MFAPTEDGPDGIETREVFLARFNQRVICAVTDAEVVILAVVHTPGPARGPAGSTRCDTQTLETAMLLTLQTVLTLVCVESLPDHLRIWAHAKRFTSRSTPTQVFTRLRLQDSPIILSGTLHQVGTLVPIHGDKEMSVSFRLTEKGMDFEYQLRSVVVVDKKNRKPVFHFEYGKR